MKSDWSALENKYSNAKNIAGQTYKKIRTNKTYVGNIMLFVTGALVLIIYAGTFLFDPTIFTSVQWWIKVIITAVAMSFMFASVSGLQSEKFKATPLYQKWLKEYNGKIYCANNNQHLGTYDGIGKEVLAFNAKISNIIWFNKLRRKAGSFYGTSLQFLVTDFSKFFEITNGQWDIFFKEQEIKPHARWRICLWVKKLAAKTRNNRYRRKSMKVISKIRANRYHIKGLASIDDVLYDTFSSKKLVSPAYDETKDTAAGTAKRFITYLLVTAMFASIFFDKAPNIGSWIMSVLNTAFTILMTISMALKWADKMHLKRQNALKKRRTMLESGFNRCGLAYEIREQYYTAIKNDDDLEEKDEIVPFQEKLVEPENETKIEIV